MMRLFTNLAAACPQPNLLQFPAWHKYLDKDPNINVCTPQITGINDIWLIVAAIIEILIRIAALVAVGYIIYGGYQYQTSQGSPDKTSKAKQTIMNALIGLVVAVLSATIIDFIARSVK